LRSPCLPVRDSVANRCKHWVAPNLHAERVDLHWPRMPIPAPESGWDKFRKTTAGFDLASAGVTAGGLVIAAVRFYASSDTVGWGHFTLVLAGLALVIQGFKARATYLEQSRRDSTHELQGCLNTLETVLLGPDLEPTKRALAGLRLTIYVPGKPGFLNQAMEYVGDQRATEKTENRSLPENMGVTGQAYQRARLDPTNSLEIHSGYRTGNDHDAFKKQMVDDYAFTPEAAAKLNPATASWVAVPIANGTRVQGVLYCDSKRADFFDPDRKEDILHAMVGIAYFVSLRYK